MNTPAQIFWDHRSWKSLLLSGLPASFFALKVVEYYPDNWPEILWFCTLSNLVLSVGLWIRQPQLVFWATGLLMAGIPIWVFDAFYQQSLSVISLFTHLVSPVLGMHWLRTQQLHGWSFAGGPLYYIFLQILARFTTPPEANINVAFRVYEPVSALFANFWLYSLTNLAMLTIFYAFLLLLLKQKTQQAAMWV
ncbi:MAG: hypothetical protein HS115_15625 [Spirochaetales bacterium]|nr:hypothetical protein [Spirochaetales bacterium]